MYAGEMDAVRCGHDLIHPRRHATVATTATATSRVTTTPMMTGVLLAEPVLVAAVVGRAVPPPSVAAGDVSVVAVVWPGSLDVGAVVGREVVVTTGMDCVVLGPDDVRAVDVGVVVEAVVVVVVVRGVVVVVVVVLLLVVVVVGVVVVVVVVVVSLVVVAVVVVVVVAVVTLALVDGRDGSDAAVTASGKHAREVGHTHWYPHVLSSTHCTGPRVLGWAAGSHVNRTSVCRGKCVPSARLHVDPLGRVRKKALSRRMMAVLGSPREYTAPLTVSWHAAGNRPGPPAAQMGSSSPHTLIR